jgi:ankyrin repeat protein
VLFEAAKFGTVNEIKSLISKGANVNTQNKYGERPLHYAAIYNNLEVIDIIIKSGADVNAKMKMEEPPFTSTFP